MILTWPSPGPVQTYFVASSNLYQFPLTQPEQLGPGADLEASVSGGATAAGDLSTQAGFAATVAGDAATTADLTTQIRFAASLIGDATAAATFALPIELGAAVSGEATVIADLAIQVGFAVLAVGDAQAHGILGSVSIGRSAWNRGLFDAPKSKKAIREYNDFRAPTKPAKPKVVQPEIDVVFAPDLAERVESAEQEELQARGGDEAIKQARERAQEAIRASQYDIGLSRKDAQTREIATLMAGMIEQDDEDFIMILLELL